MSSSVDCVPAAQPPDSLLSVGFDAPFGCLPLLTALDGRGGLVLLLAADAAVLGAVVKEEEGAGENARRG